MKLVTVTNQQLMKVLENLTDEENDMLIDQMSKTTLKDKWCLSKWFRENTKKHPEMRERCKGFKFPYWKFVFFISYCSLVLDETLNHKQSYIEQIKENIKWGFLPKPT